MAGARRAEIVEETARLDTGGIVLHRRAWHPRGHPRGWVVIVHGLGEHSGRYQHVARRLAASGLAVHAMDNRGHGLSQGQRVNVERFDDYLHDLTSLLDAIDRETEAAPPFLIGHSLGGLIVLAFALLAGRPPLAGLVLSAPAACVPARISPATVATGRLLSRLAPGLGVVRLPLDRISRDRDVLAAFMNDPLVVRCRLKARLGAEMLRTIGAVRDRAGEISLPVLVMQGGDDQLVDPGCAPALHGRLGSPDKQLRIYPGLWHEIFNEPERERVLDDVVAWLTARVPRPGPRNAGPPGGAEASRPGWGQEPGQPRPPTG